MRELNLNEMSHIQGAGMMGALVFGLVGYGAAFGMNHFNVVNLTSQMQYGAAASGAFVGLFATEY